MEEGRYRNDKMLHLEGGVCRSNASPKITQLSDKLGSDPDPTPTLMGTTEMVKEMVHFTQSFRRQ